MHREKPCHPDFASPEIPPRSTQLRIAEPPSAALGAAPVVTSGSLLSSPIHSVPETSILDLPNVEPDDSEEQILPPMDRSRSSSPAPRDFLGVTSETVSDPLELADLRASSSGDPSKSAAPVGSRPSEDWSDWFDVGMSPSSLMTADPAVLLVTPVGDSPASQSFLGTPAPAPGTPALAPVSVIPTAVTSQPLGAADSAEDVPLSVPVTQSFLASPSPRIKTEPDEIIIVSSPERTKSPQSQPSIDSLQREVRHLRRQHLSDLRQLKFLADTIATIDNETQRQPTSAERVARRTLLARGDWPRHLSGID